MAVSQREASVANVQQLASKRGGSRRFTHRWRNKLTPAEIRIQESRESIEISRVVNKKRRRRSLRADAKTREGGRRPPVSRVNINWDGWKGLWTVPDGFIKRQGASLRVVQFLFLTVWNGRRRLLLSTSVLPSLRAPPTCSCVQQLSASCSSHVMELNPTATNLITIRRIWKIAPPESDLFTNKR